MNNNTRILLRYICDGDMKHAQSQASIILKSESTKKDAKFCEDMLRKLEARHDLIELPYNLKELLVAENSELFPVSKYYFREKDLSAAKEILRLYKVSDKLASMGIPYLPAAIFYGESGCGKTELARYIAYAAGLPFIYVRFSNVVSSMLGSTQSNIAKIFSYVKSAPCVLCFDEIDALGMCRGQDNEVGEMNRIVIALMQELDQLPNNVIITGTTNRFDRLDPALVRRFPVQYKVEPMDENDICKTMEVFFEYAGVKNNIPDEWYSETISRLRGEKYSGVPVSTVIKACTNEIVSLVMEEVLE